VAAPRRSPEPAREPIAALDAAIASRYELTAAVSLPYFAIHTYRLRAVPATP
jgi:hypothetical protein